MRCRHINVFAYIHFAFLLNGYHQAICKQNQFPYVDDLLGETMWSSVETSSEKGCAIPVLNYMDPTIKEFVQYPENAPKCQNSEHPVLGNNQSHIWINKRNVPHVTTSNQTKVHCCYRGIELAQFRRPTESKIEYHECIPFNNIITVQHEFARVTCNIPYDQFFIFTHVKPFTPFREDQFATPENQPAYNILMLGISSVSRLNFHRTMPNTLNYLQSKEAIEMIGYHKVSDNGKLNDILALLVGMNANDVMKTCGVNSLTIDRCPFIWERFKDEGYYTALLEDSARLSVFNLNNILGPYGFKSKPTDYFLYPIVKEAESFKLAKQSHTCMGNKYYFQVVLDYIENLVSTLKFRKLFGVFWESSMTHKYLNNPMLMDHSYETLIKKLDSSGYLNETILILLSDQGSKWGNIYKTKQGRLEERLPFLYILLPPSFRLTYSLAYENLKMNSQRLITPYDVHNTLIDLIDLDVIKNEEVLLRSTITPTHVRSVSLFLPIPSNRTCRSGGISDRLCTCVETEKMSRTSAEACDAGSFLIKHVNELLTLYHQCAELKLDIIIQAQELLIPNERKQEWHDIVVTVRSAPGGGIFQGTVRSYANGTWRSMMTEVQRLNAAVTNQTSCINNRTLGMFCHCQY